MPIVFVPFEAFVPDGGSYGQDLSLVENLVPIYSSWRTLNKGVDVSSTADGPVNGAYVHIYQQAGAFVFMRPDGDSSAGTWEPSSGTTLYSMIDETPANDADYIFCNAPSGAVCKISLANPSATPGGTGNIIRWRYRIPNYTSGTWSLSLELMQGATVKATDTASGTAAVTAWTQRSYNLTAPEIASISDYNDLYLRFTATLVGAVQHATPTSDVSVGSWLTVSNGTTNLYQQIDESVADDSDYIKTLALTVGSTSYTYVAGLATVNDPTTNTGLVWKYRYGGANAGVKLIARLKQGTTTIKETTHTSISTSFTTQTTTLTPTEAAAITDYSTLRAEFVANYPSTVTSTVPQYARPTSDVDNSNSWTNGGGLSTINLYQEIDETIADDGTTIIVSNSAIGYELDVEYIAGLGTVLDPLIGSEHVVRFRWKRAGTGSATISVYLYEVIGAGRVTRATVANSLNKPSTDNAWTTVTYTLTAAEANAIQDYSQLQLGFVQPGVFDITQAFNVTWAELEVPYPRKARVSWVDFEVPSQNRAEVSWSEFETPDVSTTYRGDIPTIIAGTRQNLYEVAQSGWTDISGTTYASGASNPAAWSLCSFGNNVIATNYVDEVQYRADNTGNFANLITSVEKPKARFVVPFKASLLLGGINLSSHFDDEVWWSAVEDARDFHPSITTQCDYQRLTSAPGQITGLVGGEFAVVFKRRSIHALDWMGGTTIVRVRDVSGSIGTSHPRSIVSADGMIYFWGGRSFFVTDGYSAPVPIGDETVANYLSDGAFSSGAMQPYTPASIMEEDQLMIGWFDPAAGLVCWHYMATGESGLAVDAIHGTFESYQATIQNAVSRHSRAICYSPSEKRWSTIFFPLTYGAPGVAYCCQRGNVIGSETFLMKGTVGFTWDGTTSRYFRFSDSTTYRGSLTTKRRAIAIDQQDRPTSVRITGILPAFSVKTDSATWPDMTIYAYGANDIQFLENLRTETYQRVAANEAGWYPHDLAGTWFQFNVAVPEINGKVVTAFRGLFVRYDDARGRSAG